MMTASRDETDRILEELALLPDTDPRRRSLQERINDDSDSRRQEWCDIVAENENLRLRLNDLSPPPGLQARLQAVRDERRGSAPPIFLNRFARIAAVLVIIGSIVAILAIRETAKWTTDRAMYELATLAAFDHAARPALSVRMPELDALAAGLTDAPFDLEMTSPEPQAVLSGGRVCSFGDRPLIYTCWRDGERDVAVYQVKRIDFGLRAQLPARLLSIPKDGSLASRSRVRIWSDDEFAFAVVYDRHRPGQ